MTTLLASRRVAAGAMEKTGVEAPRVLVSLTLGYIMIPSVGLLVAWLTPPLALIAAVAGVTLLIRLLTTHHGLAAAAGRWPPPVSIGAGLVVTLTSGVLGLTNHAGDWRKHFAILRDLSERPWPLTYDLGDGVHGIASYYFAGYLPAGAIGRIFGWTAANVALTGWMALGWVLVFWWFAVLVGRSFAPLLLLSFGGLDVIGRAVLPAISGWPTIGDYDQTIGAWSGDMQVTSVLRSAYEAWPQVIPAMLFMALGLAGWFRVNGCLRAGAVVAAAALASPFGAAVGLLVLLGSGLVVRVGKLPRSRIEAVASVTMMGLVVLFFATRLAGPPEGIPNEVTIGSSLTVSRFGAGPADMFVSLLLVAVLKGGLLGGILLSHRSSLEDDDRRLLRVAMLVGAALLFFRVGLNNDLVMRGTTPLVFVLAVMAARQLAAREASRPVSLAVAVYLVLTLVSPVLEFYGNAFGTPSFEPAYSPTDPDKVPGLVDLGPRWYSDRPSLLSQYLVTDKGPPSVLLDGG